MKLAVTLSLTGMLLLGACAPQQTETPAPAAVQKKPVQDENAEIANGEKPDEFDMHITDPKVAAGEEIYERSCAGCHESRTGGAPKPGDKEDWAPRIKQGMETMTKMSIAGFEGKQGAMPAKGGNEELTDQEVGNAVLYMVEKSK